jgi:type II secretory pathway component GspD/PulD (secretin)
VKAAIVREFYGVKFANASEVADALGKGLPELKVTSVEKTLIVDGTAVQQASAAKLLSTLDVEVRGERMIRAYKLKYLHPHQASFTLRPLFPNLIVQAGFEPYSPPTATFRPLSLETEKAFSKEGLGGNAGAGGTSSATGGGGGGGGIGGGPQDLSGTAAEVEQATRLLDAEDVVPQQVIIEAKMVDISPEKFKSLGLEYDWSPLNFTEFTRGGGNPGRTFAGAFGRTPFNFSVALNALERSTDAKILSRPNITVVDGEEASIFIGDILRYERLSSVSDNGQQIFTIENVPVGVALLCRPRINGNRVTLKVHPTVSTIKDFGGRNNDIPITASREADTTVVLNDGDTFSIGGLLRDEDIKTMTKVPVLGDLPFIGNLFRSRQSRKNKSEVTIFLTVRIVDLK